MDEISRIFERKVRWIRRSIEGLLERSGVDAEFQAHVLRILMSIEEAPGAVEPLEVERPAAQPAEAELLGPPRPTPYQMSEQLCSGANIIPATVDAIMKLVESAYFVTREQIRGLEQGPHIWEARRVSVHLVQKFFRLRGRHLREATGKDPHTVRDAIHKLEHLRAASAELDQHVRRMEDHFIPPLDTPKRTTAPERSSQGASVPSGSFAPGSAAIAPRRRGDWRVLHMATQRMIRRLMDWGLTYQQISDAARISVMNLSEILTGSLFALQPEHDRIKAVLDVEAAKRPH
jgi:hypothetical protein